LNGLQGISGAVKGVLAIDGKTLRRSADKNDGKKALHMVSAWAAENRLVLAQVEARSEIQRDYLLSPCS